jgi:PAS domain S-box-containing protein
MNIHRDDWYSRLLRAITTAQDQLLGVIEPDSLFDGLLRALLDLTDSEYGFVGETLRKANGDPYLKTHAITNIAWNEETRRFYEDNVPNGLEFYNLKTLFGVVLTDEVPVIANSPATDPRRGGLPDGHPPLRAFLGLPLRSGGEMIGMAGVANRPEGYDEKLVQDLEPFLQTCSNAIFALRADMAREMAEGKLVDEQQRLRAILDGAYEAIITIDESGIIESCNSRAETMFGYSSDAMCGKNVSILMPEPYRSEHDGYLKRYCETGRARVIGLGREAVGRRRNGTDFPIHLTINEVHVGHRRLFTGLVRDLSERDEARKRLDDLKAQLERSQFGQIVGRSPAMRQLYETIGDVAKGDWTVLVEGETGTGKELVARAIHASSPRKDGPFIAVNCAGLTDTLLGSQLFGHRRGAFTGAVNDQPGFFKAAEGGTLFLDEIGDISESVQNSLLRVLEEREFIRIGDTAPQATDVRVIVATNRDLSREVKAGRFREDLLYRLRVGRVMVPPLRDRREDISLLVEAFLAEARIATGKAITGLSQAAQRSLTAYRWPGNVRELRSAVQFAAIHCRRGLIGVSDLPPELQQAVIAPAAGRSTVAEGDEELSAALERAGGNRTRAAELLGISRATLYRRLNELKTQKR